MPTLWLSDMQSTTQHSTSQQSHFSDIIHRSRRSLLLRRRPLPLPRPAFLLRPRPPSHGQHPLPPRHHPPPRPAANTALLRAETEVERECGVLGGDNAHIVTLDVCGVFGRGGGDFLFVWGVSIPILVRCDMWFGCGWCGVREVLTWCVRRFFKTMAGFAYNIPVIGPYLARGLQVAGDKAGANERAHKDLPV